MSHLLFLIFALSFSIYHFIGGNTAAGTWALVAFIIQFIWHLHFHHRIQSSKQPTGPIFQADH